MAEMVDIFDDAPSGKSSSSGGKLKRLLKNKKFLAACAVVAVVALFVAWKRNQEGSYYDGSQAIGYAGYPTTGGGGGEGAGSDTSYVDDYQAALEQVQKEYNASLDSVTKEYDSTMDSLYSNINDLGNQITSLQEANEAQQLKAQRDLDLGQMKANSALYHYTNDKATQDALHKQNAAIAAKYGWDYDEQSGQYFENGIPVYGRADLGPLPTGAQTVAPKVPTGSATWEKNVDYQKKINEAILSGATGAQIDAINAQRDAKIRDTGAKGVNSQFDKDTDYTALIKKAKASGASRDVINNLTQQRQAKINSLYAGVDPDSSSRGSSGSSSSRRPSSSSSSSSSRRPSSSSGSSSSRRPSSSSGSGSSGRSNSQAENRKASQDASAKRAAERAAHNLASSVSSSFKFRR